MFVEQTHVLKKKKKKERIYISNPPSFKKFVLVLGEWEHFILYDYINKNIKTSMEFKNKGKICFIVSYP